MSLREAVAMVPDGAIVALGGNVLHRAPMAFVRELVRQKKKHLNIVKTAGAHDIDLLCAANCVQSVSAGFVSYESKFGLANFYRKSVQAGKVIAHEHACYTVIAALRGASMNVPFMPVHGLQAGDLLLKNDYFIVVEDPFTGQPITLVKTIVPDFAVIHVQEADVKGNARIYGPKFEDVLMSRAAKKVIITAENIVSESKMKMQHEYIDIPGFLVAAVVHAPRGARPCSCYKNYEIDDKMLTSFIQAKTEEDIKAYLQQYEAADHAGERRRLVWV